MRDDLDLKLEILKRKLEGMTRDELLVQLESMDEKMDEILQATNVVKTELVRRRRFSS